MGDLPQCAVGLEDQLSIPLSHSTSLTGAGIARDQRRFSAASLPDSALTLVWNLVVYHKPNELATNYILVIQYRHLNAVKRVDDRVVVIRWGNAWVSAQHDLTASLYECDARLVDNTHMAQRVARVMRQLWEEGHNFLRRSWRFPVRLTR